MSGKTERKLLETIEEQTDYVGIKVDIGAGFGHGYKSGHDAGDIIVGKPIDAKPVNRGLQTLTDLIIIEEKYKSTDANKYLQEDGEKFDAMIEMALAMGATPVLAVRWSSRLEWSRGARHLLRNALEVDRTKSGNVSVSPGDTRENDYKTVEEFFGRRP